MIDELSKIDLTDNDIKALCIEFKNKSKCILLFCDMQAASHFKGCSWMAQYLKSKKIEIKVIGLPKHIREKVLKAQDRQGRNFKLTS